MRHTGFFSLVFLALNAQLAWGGVVSSGGLWEITRTVSGTAGETVTTAGVDTVHQSVGEALAMNTMTGGTDRILSGYLSSFPPAAEMIEKLLSAGGVQAAGMTGVLATNNSINVQFYVDVDTNTLALPGTLTVRAVMDYLGAPISVAWPTTYTYDYSTRRALVSPVSGNWNKGTLYELYASTDIADLNGNPRLEWSTYTFTTIRDEFVNNVAIMRNEPAVQVAVAPNVFNAPYIMMISSGITTSAVVAANEKALSLGAERKPIKTIQVDSYNNTGQEWTGLLAQNVPLTMTYPDLDANGIIDGTKLRTKTLSVWHLDENQSLWTKQTGASVNTGGQNVVYPTNHFSVFGLFGSVDADVTDVYAFPVPFRPNAGDTARYGSWAEGIKFINLPTEGTISIYTLFGQKVRSMDVTGTQLAWDVRNSEGQQVASGVYIWEIRSKNNSKSGKIVVIK